MPHVKGISEKLKCIGNWRNIRTVFKTKNAVSSSLMTARPERNPQILAHLVCSLLCDCSRSSFREIGWPLGMWLRENSHNWKELLLQRLKRAENFDGSNRTGWNKSRILQVKINLLKSGSYFVYKFVLNINNCEFREQITLLFSTDFGANSGYFPVTISANCFYNRIEICLLRGT